MNDESTKQKDNVSHPAHYVVNGVEVLDVIEAYGCNFHIGNVIKYSLRYKNKNGLEDLKKAQFYLNRYITLCEEKNNV